MQTLRTTTILASLMLTVTFACDSESADLGTPDERQTALEIEDEALSSWEAEKLDEADAALLLDEAEDHGFTLVEDISFAYPVEGLALAELEGAGDLPAFLSFDVDDEGVTSITTLVIPEGEEGEALIYSVIEGEVTLVTSGPALGVEGPQAPVENECHTWGHCNCIEFAAAIGVCAVNGMYTPAFYACIRFFCE